MDQAGQYCCSKLRPLEARCGPCKKSKTATSIMSMMPKIHVYRESRCAYAVDSVPGGLQTTSFGKMKYVLNLQPLEQHSNNPLASQPSKTFSRPGISSPPPLTTYTPPATQKSKNSRTNRLASTLIIKLLYHVEASSVGASAFMLCHQDRYAGPIDVPPTFWTTLLPRDRNIRSQSQGVRAVEMFRLPLGMVGGGEVPACRCLCHDGVGGGMVAWVGEVEGT